MLVLAFRFRPTIHPPAPVTFIHTQVTYSQRTCAWQYQQEVEVLQPALVKTLEAV
jgi:hypothetical protein